MASKVKRSYTGCLTCKSRKLKCDEAKPSCRHCVKASRECTYGDQHIFRSQPIHSTPRRKRKDRRSVQQDESPVFEEGHTWLEVPSELTFVQIEDPWAHDNAGVEKYPRYVSYREDDVNDDDQNNDTDIGEQTNFSSHYATPGFVSMHASPIPYVPSLDTPHKSASPAYSESANHSEFDIFDKVVISYLVRHFKEGPGQWCVLQLEKELSSC
ncbi:hypothetical protein N7532_009499 [Penicillium argentinense]|uniref:Zn(2)-C6 fungal-type domain-containing protein n=1 Tax=Penicillium argentinense TaxID=1131581 RepID=A0A9W9EZI6_9EURO|nr:uncharacterized protein N7532_009499 [Penicillium argentinense]KAJ5090815.1 hypothetical protein N7532_009499 [Penicillium argentinense]